MIVIIIIIEGVSMILFLFFVNWIFLFSPFESGVCVSSPPHTHTPTPIGTLVGVGRLGYDVAISEDNFQQYERRADREMKVYSAHTQDRWSDCAVLLISPSQRKEGRKKRRGESSYIGFSIKWKTKEKRPRSLCSSTFRRPPFSPNNTKAYKHSLRNPGSAIGIVFLDFFF